MSAQLIAFLVDRCDDRSHGHAEIDQSGLGEL
jgi:hypothetical protein